MSRLLAVVAVACFAGSIAVAAFGANNLARESARPVTDKLSGFTARPDPRFPGYIGLFIEGYIGYGINPSAFQPQPTIEEFNAASSAVFWYLDHTFYEDARGPEVIELESPSGSSYFSWPGAPRNQAEMAQETSRRAALDQAEVTTGWTAVLIAGILFVLGVAIVGFASRSMLTTALAGLAALSVLPIIGVATFNTVTWRHTPAVAVPADSIVGVTCVVWLVAGVLMVALVVVAKAPRRWLVAPPVGFVLAAISVVGIAFAIALHMF